MYDQVLTYITSIASSIASVITAIMMFLRIITATREMCGSLRNDMEKTLTEVKDVQYAHTMTLSDAVKQVTNSNEIKQIKEQYQECMTLLEQLTRQNAELLARLDQK